MSILRPVRPTLFENDLGRAAWLDLHVTAKQRGRKPEAQTIEWLRYAAYQKQHGFDVELTQTQLAELLAREAESDQAVA